MALSLGTIVGYQQQSAKSSEGTGAGAKGMVKWFDDRKGCGFVENEGGKEYLVYYSAVKDTPEDLRDRVGVEFDTVDTPRAPQAAEVRRIDVDGFHPSVLQIFPDMHAR